MKVEELRGAPSIEVTHGILRSAIEQRASRIRIYVNGDGLSVVDFVIADKLVQVMQPPLDLHAQIVRRVSVMASVPSYPKGEFACGRMRVFAGQLEDDSYFDVTIRGHGARLLADLFNHGPLAAPPEEFCPPGVEWTHLPLR